MEVCVDLADIGCAYNGVFQCLYVVGTRIAGLEGEIVAYHLSGESYREYLSLSFVIGAAHGE